MEAYTFQGFNRTETHILYTNEVFLFTIISVVLADLST